VRGEYPGDFVFSGVHHLREALELFFELVVFFLDFHHFLDQVHVGLYLGGRREGGREAGSVT